MPEKDSTRNKDYRPISMMNTDTKNLSKILSKLNSTLIKMIIHDDHWGLLLGNNNVQHTEVNKCDMAH